MGLLTRESFSRTQCTGLVRPKRFTNKEGLYKKTNGFSYNGGYKLNMKHGFGTISYPDGGKYEGEFADNKKNGKGKLI